MAELIDLGFLATPETIEAAVVSTAADAEQTAADVTAAEAARVAAEAAKNAAQAVGTTNDTIIAGQIANPASATNAALAGAFAPKHVHLIGLWGQSNMSGRGTDFSTFKDPALTRIKQFGSGASALTAATEPLLMHDTPTGIGPGLQFARQWIADLPADDVIVLVPSAHGSTPLVSNAILGWRAGVTGNLTAQAMTQMESAVTAAQAAYPGAKVSVDGILFFLGETDSATGVAVTGAAWRTDALALVDAARTRFGNTTLPFIFFSFIPEAMDVGTRAQIRGVQSWMPYEKAATGFVVAPPAGFSNGDALHANATAHRLYYGPGAYSEFRRIRGGRAASTPDLRVPDPTPVPAIGATVWADTFTTADAATRLVTDTANVAWGTTPADGTNASTIGVKGNAAAIYRATGTTTVFRYPVVTPPVVIPKSRWIVWDWETISTTNVRNIFCYGGIGQYYSIRAVGTTFDVRRYDTETAFATIATATVAFDTSPTVKVLLDRPTGSPVAYLSVWVDDVKLVDAVSISSYIDNVIDGTSYVTTSTADAVRHAAITVSAVA